MRPRKYSIMTLGSPIYFKPTGYFHCNKGLKSWVCSCFPDSTPRLYVVPTLYVAAPILLTQTLPCIQPQKGTPNPATRTQQNPSRPSSDSSVALEWNGPRRYCLLTTLVYRGLGVIMLPGSQPCRSRTKGTLSTLRTEGKEVANAAALEWAASANASEAGLSITLCMNLVWLLQESPSAITW